MTASSARPLRIAGAGPSGLVAAALLARAGREVVVHEKNATVGARFIGDFQVIEDASDPRETVPEMLARLSLSPPPWTRATHARFFDARLASREVRSERPYGWFVTRGPDEGTLDTTLLSQARAAGVRDRNFEANLCASGRSRDMPPPGRLRED